MILFECDDFEVIFQPGRTDMLLVTFSSLGMFSPTGSWANGHVFWGRALVEKWGCSGIGFVARHRNWFCSDHMPAACQVVKERAAAYGTVISYGSSMGGYAALRWAREVGAGTAVAFAPQFSIDPAVVGHGDHRYAGYFKPELKGMGIGAADVAPQNFVLVDRTDRQDMLHVGMIRDRVPGLQVVPLDFCGHECIRVFAGNEPGQRLLQGCASGRTEAVLALAAVYRRQAPIRRVELANRLLPAKPRWAEAIFRTHIGKFEVIQRARFEDRLAALRAARA
jgi:hypothetical protein